MPVELLIKWCISLTPLFSSGELKRIFREMGYLPAVEIIDSLKLVDYLHVHADKPWYNYYNILIAW